MYVKEHLKETAFEQHYGINWIEKFGVNLLYTSWKCKCMYVYERTSWKTTFEQHYGINWIEKLRVNLLYTSWKFKKSNAYK